MKHLFTTIVFTLLLHSAFGQKIRFTDGGNVWKSEMESLDTWVYVQNVESHFDGDTIINGLQYKKLSDLLVREDTLAKKVYCRAKQHQTYRVDTNEVVLYDYNLVVGDSVTRQDTQGDVWRHGVVSVDSFFYNAYWYKVWTFAGRRVGNGAPAGQYVVIEGIGSVNTFSTLLPYYGPLYPVSPFESFGHLLCFTGQNGNPVIHPGIPYLFPIWGSLVNSFDNDSSCAVRVDVASVDVHSGLVSVYPNPANNNTEIRCSWPVQKGSVIIYNSIGSKVYGAIINNQSSVPIGKYLSTTGQYFYRLTDESNGQQYTGSFISQ